MEEARLIEASLFLFLYVFVLLKFEQVYAGYSGAS